jgi:hypothetical protein
MFPKSLEVGFDGEQRLLGDGGIGARAVNSSVLVAKTAPRGRQFAMLPTVEMRFRPLENIHARYIRDAFLRQRAPGLTRPTQIFSGSLSAAKINLGGAGWRLESGL